MGDRQRFTPAQDPDQPEGKILRLTLDGKPAPGNPNFGKTGAATIPLIDPPSDTETAKNAKVVSTYTFPGPNVTPAETWTSGHRTPYGMAFSPSGELWEVEHGPRGGDELNLLKAGANYGWPLATHGIDYDGSIISPNKSLPGMEDPLRVWTPSISPCGLCFYTGDTFPGWKGSLFTGGLSAYALFRIELEGERYAREERLIEGRLPYIRDVRQGPDGLLYLVTHSDDGGLFRLDPA